MQQIEPVRPSQRVSIAGFVIDDFTKKAHIGTKVRIVEAPEAFARRIVIPARQVWLGAPPTLDDPQAALDHARSVLKDPLAKLQERVIQVRVVFNTTLATSADEFLAAQTVLDYQDSRLSTAAKRPDQTNTAADGSFFFSSLPDGAYKLRAWLPGSGSRYKDDEKSIQVTAPAPAPAPVPATLTMIKLSLSPTGLKGRIVDEASTSSPMAGIDMAEVRVEGSGEFTFSGSDLDPQKSGAYRLIGLEAGSRKVRVSAQGYKSESQLVDLTYGEVLGQDIPLTKI